MSHHTENAVIVSNVSKGFKIPLDQSSGIKQHIVNFFKRKKGYREFTALEDVSFEIKKGEFFGIVGRNGSGKSTLLKIIAQIYNADSGGVTVNGSLVPFIELGVGFNPELTGRENVFLNGALLGFDKSQMESMYEEIIDFAELHDFMEEKLKNYSSGMQVRLAFSIAIRAESDILLLDEVLAVGDEAFQRKCFQYFAKLKKDKKTVILVTHSMDSVQQFCNRAMLIDKGHRTVVGSPLEIARIYRELNMPVAPSTGAKTSALSSEGGVSISVKDDVSDEKASFDICIESKVQIDDASVAFIINRDNGEMVYRWVLDEKVNQTIDFKKGQKKRIHLEVQNILPNGVYSVRVSVRKRDKSKDYIIIDDIANFEIIGKTNNAPFWKPNETFKLTND